MRKRSEVWKKLAARGMFSVDTVAIINGVVYDKISAPKIDRQTMSKVLSVGNCCNASCTFSVLPDEGQTIPAGAKIVIKSRLFDESKGLESEWMEMGTFFIDERADGYEGLVNIKSYDAMLKVDQAFVADDNYNTLGWPLPMTTVVEMIADRLGVSIDPRTQIKTGTDYVCDLPSNYTVRQVLSGIACCHGGNWIITEENQLRLVPLVQIPDETYKILDADFEDIIVPNDNRLVWKQTENTVPKIGNDSIAKVTISDKARKDYHIVDGDNKIIVTNDGYTLVWASDSDYYANYGMLNVPAVLGELKTSDKLTVVSVVASRTVLQTQTTDEESEPQSVTTTFYAKDGNKQGFELNAGDCPYMTQQICDDLCSEYSGLTYAPYSATNAIFDPALEIGDQIKFGDTIFSVVNNISITLNTCFSADLSLPFQEQSTSEYPYNGIEAQIKDTNIKLQSQILRLDNSITLKVKAVADDLEDLDVNRVAKVELAVSPTGIGSTISAMAGTISLTAGKLLITSGNFLLDKNGNVTINNGKFKGTVETGVGNDNFGVKIATNEIKITSEGVDYLRLMPSQWGRGSNPNTEPGTQLRANNYFYIADTDGGQYFAVITCDQINGLQEGIHCFRDVYIGYASSWNPDVYINMFSTLNLGSNAVTFNGNFIKFDSVLYGDNFYFNSPPISSSNSTSLSYLLQKLWTEVFG